MELLWALPVGLAIGILSGFFGVGGGFILTPILLIIGFSPTIAIATSLLFTTSTSISGTWAHLKMHNVIWKTAFSLAISGVIATQIAHPIVLWMGKMGSDHIVIPVLYLILLAYFAVTVFRHKKEPHHDYKVKASLYKVAFIGFFGGFASAVLGVGGGFIMVPLLIAFLGFDPQKAVGTSLLSIFFIVLAGFISYAFTTPINYLLSVFLIIGALLGTHFGAKLTTLYQDRQIQHFLGGLYIVTFLSVFTKLVFQFSILGLIIIGAYVIFLLILFAIKMVQNSQRLRSND